MERVSAETCSSWSSTDEVCCVRKFWLVTVPERVPAVVASELRPLLSWGSALELMALRASVAEFSVDCVEVLNWFDSFVVPATVFLVSVLS